MHLLSNWLTRNKNIWAVKKSHTFLSLKVIHTSFLLLAQKIIIICSYFSFNRVRLRGIFAHYIFFNRKTCWLFLYSHMISYSFPLYSLLSWISFKSMCSLTLKKALIVPRQFLKADNYLGQCSGQKNGMSQFYTPSYRVIEIF